MDFTEFKLRSIYIYMKSKMYFVNKGLEQITKVWSRNLVMNQGIKLMAAQLSNFMKYMKNQKRENKQ